MTMNRTTYVKACNIEVKFELAEVGTEIKSYSQDGSPKGECDGTYSERMIPELNMSFAKIVP